MESIPPLFWMFIITLLTVGVFMILFYIAMAVRESIGLIKESTDVLKEVKEVVHETRTILVDVQLITSSVRASVDKFQNVANTINNSIVKPIRNIGQILGFVSSFVPGRRDEIEEEDIDEGL